jgi:hypothetical protein
MSYRPETKFANPNKTATAMYKIGELFYRCATGFPALIDGACRFIVVSRHSYVFILFLSCDKTGQYIDSYDLNLFSSHFLYMNKVRKWNVIPDNLTSLLNNQLTDADEFTI